MSRWIFVTLVSGYVVLVGVIVVVLLIVIGVRMSDPVRWLILVGWIASCFGGVFVVERLFFFGWPGFRRPIKTEEERLVTLMDEVQRRVGSKMRIRFIIGGKAETPTRSMGYRTVIVQSGSLMLASDGELKGVLAHELGHLRDGDQVMEAALATAGGFAQVFLWWCRCLRWGFGRWVTLGVLMFVVGIVLLWPLLPFYLLDRIFRLILWGLKRQIDYRQDRFAFRAGYGDGLRAWLVRSGLAANVSRIRRLESLV